MYVKNGIGVLEQVLLSDPNHVTETSQINEIAKKWDLRKIDDGQIQREFEQVQNLYQKLGIQVQLAQATEILPHGVFARDFGCCVKEGYVLGRYKHGIRQPETHYFKAQMEKLGIPLLGTISGNGIFEGGDFVLLNEHTIAVGLLDRTNENGFRQLKELLEPFGYSLHAVKAKSEYLHLDMCFNLITPDTAIGYKAGLPDEFLDLLQELNIALIEGTEAAIFQHGYNVQAIGNRRVISLAQNQWLNTQMRHRNIEVYEINLEETLKLGGGIHCMTFPLKRA
ncbi:dimethylarginine dimethylaminohydrolase family protein [Enterococcus sp. AZ109]|uniref:dimethylarginine dimethylaminohydrolase family protein n=1 Tax=Enterococcus sp. AZ109 TaxID=2774634 RepID=UPI003F247538